MRTLGVVELQRASERFEDEIGCAGQITALDPR